jgi:hypothetical protein
VVFGFADEFVRLLESRGGLTAPQRYGKTWTRVHDPLMWREAADHLLREAGVRILFHTVITGALLDGHRVIGAAAWSKEGPVELRARLSIDASGDADLVAMAGFEAFVGDDGRVQNPTMIFRLGGVDVARFLAAYGEDTIMPEAVSELLRRTTATATSCRARRSGCSRPRGPASCSATAPASSAPTAAS